MTSDNRALDESKRCGTCSHAKPTVLTPAGKPKKRYAWECNAPVTVVAPISYRVTLSRSFVWPDDEADKCTLWTPRP